MLKTSLFLYLKNYNIQHSPYKICLKTKKIKLLIKLYYICITINEETDTV
jgi:hypothetical protein